eukprot:1195116-Prorocentrum_minimum.AAC.10
MAMCVAVSGSGSTTRRAGPSASPAGARRPYQARGHPSRPAAAPARPRHAGAPLSPLPTRASIRLSPSTWSALVRLSGRMGAAKGADS